MDNDARDDESPHHERVTIDVYRFRIKYRKCDSIGRSMNHPYNSRRTIRTGDKKLMHTNRDPSSSAPTLTK